MGALNRIVNETHPDVFLESGDTVIFSSKMIPGNEKTLLPSKSNCKKKYRKYYRGKCFLCTYQGILTGKI